MKLSPPASSSDLEAAREIALRLHQRRRRGDRPEVDEPTLRRPVFSAHLPAVVEPPEPPGWDEPVGEPAPAPEAALDALASLEEPLAAEEPQTGAGVLELDAEVPDVSPEELVGVGTSEAPPIEDLSEPPGALPSPFDVEVDETPADEVIDVPTSPSWDDVVVGCLNLARTRGAMLVDPTGRVLAARGEWPEPGPDAIAAKLVATMDRTLKDAPTRSISAPLMGKHLTAWRVSLADGLVTAAFIGDTPLHAEARTAIDADIHRAGA